MKYRDPKGKEEEKVIRPGEFIMVHHGVEHMPYALEESHMVLFEPGSTLDTGMTQNEHTVSAPQWI